MTSYYKKMFWKSITDIMWHWLCPSVLSISYQNMKPRLFGKIVLTDLHISIAPILENYHLLKLSNTKYTRYYDTLN